MLFVFISRVIHSRLIEGDEGKLRAVALVNDDENSMVPAYVGTLKSFCAWASQHQPQYS